MIKSFLIITSFSILLFSSQQILLVVADDFNSSKAIMECYEDNKLICKSVEVNLGKNGLAWGIGAVELPHNPHEVKKYEGDNKAPAGVFKLTNIFGYMKKSHYKLPYLYASKNLICVDDSNANFYNQIIEANGDEKSFEFMRRQDKQYSIGIQVEHNKGALKQRGSCIFIHVQKEANHATAGCTSMQYAQLQKIVKWLDKKKNPLLVQIPKKYAPAVRKLYPQLEHSQLLH
ncbi:L,D-transpeptidase family protein [Sulfurimonas sp.]